MSRIARFSTHAKRVQLLSPMNFDGRFNFVKGKRVGARGETASNLFPATGQPNFSFNYSNVADVEFAVCAAREAQPSWREAGPTARGALLARVASKVREHRLNLANAEVLDTGKTHWEAQFDIDNCADVLDFYAGLAPLLAGQHWQLPGRSWWFTNREPFGVCAGIGAWNYPFQMAVFKSAPALLCGNTFVFKPAQLTPTTALLLAEIFVEAGAPEGVFNVVQGAGETGTALISHQGVDKVSFTGGAHTGSHVMRYAATRTLPVTLELGGKSALIIFEDADLDEAVKGAVLANFLSQGQVCSNASRVFVHHSILPTFTHRLLETVRLLRVGDPFEEGIALGAMISPEHAQRVLDHLTSARTEGAQVLAGGERCLMEGEFSNGFFLPATVLAECSDTMRAVREEIFGPVLTLLSFESEDEVLTRANETEYGLAGGLFTRDLGRAHRVAQAMAAGSLYINNYNALPPGLPFGGMRRSGIGRENAAMDTLMSYSQVKSVYVEGDSIDYPFPFPSK